jgi:hypothetical protein
MLVSLMQSAPLKGLVFRLRVLSFGPPLGAFGVLYLLAVSPQMREVYLGIIEAEDYARGGLGLLLLVLLCSLIYTWHYSVATSTINYLYPEHADLDLDLGLMSWRNAKALLCAAAPIIGLSVGLVSLYLAATSASMKFEAISEYFTLAAAGSDAVSIRGSSGLSRLPLFVAVSGALMIVALAAIHTLLRRAALGHHLRSATLWAALGITVLTTVVPLMVPDKVVPLYRMLGPLATVAVALIAIVTALIMISMGLRRLEPSLLMALVVAAIAAAAFYVLFTSFDLERTPAAAKRHDGTGTGSGAPSKQDEPMRAAFRQWLVNRADLEDYAGRPYPVFIVAAQGGGIYSASAAASFLASLQDHCGNFAQHVFAISGVSGGAVGGALFNALMSGREQVADLCRGGTDTRLAALTQRIIEADHLSPVVALIAPDLVRKVPVLEYLRPGLDRSTVLERSFACSFDAAGEGPSEPQASGCGPAAGSSGLRAPVEESWSPSGAAPALVLNTTWSEKGYRVAFAPFALHAIGDGTLYNFSELPLDRAEARRSLIEAAFVSARFPGIVPAWTVQPSIPGTTGQPWSFVDGAYVDNSGATTALELYKLIEDMIRKEGLNIDLRLVLLTDAETVLDFSTIRGSYESEIAAPAAALLSVRAQLSQRAVTQAIEYVTNRRRWEPVENRAAGEEHVLSVDVEQQTFPLPLGWKISGYTNYVVRVMMGRPDLCPPSGRSIRIDSEKFSEVRSYLRTIENNSCVKRKIVELLGRPG